MGRRQVIIRQEKYSQNNLFKNTRFYKQEIREGKRLWLYNNNIHKMKLLENTRFKQEIREEKGYYYTMG